MIQSMVIFFYEHNWAFMDIIIQTSVMKSRVEILLKIISWGVGGWNSAPVGTVVPDIRSVARNRHSEVILFRIDELLQYLISKIFIFLHQIIKNVLKLLIGDMLPIRDDVALNKTCCQGIISPLDNPDIDETVLKIFNWKPWKLFVEVINSFKNVFDVFGGRHSSSKL